MTFRLWRCFCLNFDSRMDLLPGLMVLTASLEGFSPAVVEVQISEEPSAQSVTISLSPTLDPHTEMRLVMNWGRLPKDLDLHVLQIDRFNFFCVYPRD